MDDLTTLCRMCYTVCHAKLERRCAIPPNAEAVGFPRAVYMTLTAEESSNKAEYEALTTGEVIKRIRTAMEAGCIRPCHVFDLVDEVLDRLAKVSKLMERVDLTKCSPLPWKSQLLNIPIADTGDYNSFDIVIDGENNDVVDKYAGSISYRNVEKEDGDHDADILAICDSVNAIVEAKKILNIKEK